MTSRRLPASTPGSELPARFSADERPRRCSGSRARPREPGPSTRRHDPGRSWASPPPVACYEGGDAGDRRAAGLAGGRCSAGRGRAPGRRRPDTRSGSSTSSRAPSPDGPLVSAPQATFPYPRRLRWPVQLRAVRRDAVRGRGREGCVDSSIEEGLPTLAQELGRFPPTSSERYWLASGGYARLALPSP